jgi:hypothetical protein
LRETIVLDDLDVLLHPVRIRIMHALFTGRAHTVPEVRRQLPDLPQVTVDEQVDLMVNSGLISAASHDGSRIAISPRGLQHLRQTHRSDSDHHRRRISTALAYLADEINAYLDNEESNLHADAVSLLQRPLWLTAAELAELTVDLVQAVEGRSGNLPTGDRRRYLLSHILFPSDAPVWA